MAERSTLFDKVYGCLLGGAIGDAFGIRTEMMHFRDIEAQYGRVTHFDALPARRPSTQPALERFQPFGIPLELEGGFHPLGRWSSEVGVYTDDTRYRLIACQAVLRKRGSVEGADLAAEWLNYRLMAEGADDHAPTWTWSGPERTYARHVASVEALSRMAQERRPLRAGWDTPMGLINACDPERAADVGSSMAVAVATAMQPEASIDDVIANALRFAHCLGPLANEFIGRMNRLLDVAASCADVFALREPFYREFLVTFPPWEPVFSLEMVPCALALCVIARGDAEQAIVGAANLGRDSDTIASMAGEIAGTLGGARGLPPAWVEKVLRVNPEPDLAQVAEGLCNVLRERARSTAAIAEQLMSLT
jgi:ADP-ribosylglycohydrolase